MWSWDPNIFRLSGGCQNPKPRAWIKFAFKFSKNCSNLLIFFKYNLIYTYFSFISYLAMNDPLHAAAILYRCADPKSMYTAVYVCCKFNFKEEAESYGYFCMEKCLSQSDWPTLYKLVELLDSLKVRIGVFLYTSCL